jgi:transcriptional regulator with XRE-family HTH domain
MNLKILRRKKGYRQSDLAKKLNTSTMILSLLENYDVIPTPKMMVDIEDALESDRLEIYNKKDIQLIKRKNTKFNVPDDYEYYHVHVRLPKAYKELLTKENFRKAGYGSLTHWLYHKIRNFQRQLKHIDDYYKKKAKKKRHLNK